MIAIAILVVWFFIILVVAVATIRLATRVFGRTNAFGVIAKTIATLATLGATIALLGTFAGLLTVFRAVAGRISDVTQKARMLAEGISEAMNCTAFGILIWLPFFITMLVIARRKKVG